MSTKAEIHILIIDDSPAMLKSLTDTLNQPKYKIETAPGAFEAIRILEAQTVDIVIIDIHMPATSGIDLIKYIREKFSNIEIIVILDSASLAYTTQTAQYNVDEYLIKPFKNKQLLAMVDHACEKLEMRGTMKEQMYKLHSAPFGIIGTSPPMRKIMKEVEKAAITNATVIISGDNGTGKELTARAIHYCSPRASAPFVPVNCASIPENLIESELFGHVKGSFTGAFETRPGFFQIANVGTIFLDEISETSLAMQAKLLRVIQEKEIYMVGSRKAQKVDVRILASTNKNLGQLIRTGHFREDLFYRLNVINIHLPPLNERKEDIPLLIHFFTTKFSKELKKQIPRYSDDAMGILTNYDWPGNVRELENVIHRLMIMSEEPVIALHSLRFMMGRNMSKSQMPLRTLAEMEADYIKRVLEAVNNNKTQAAKVLGIDRKTLRKKLEQKHSRPH